MSEKYLISLDEGTTSARAVVFDRSMSIVSMAQKEFTQIFPQAGWVEHDAMEIFAGQISVLSEAIAKLGIGLRDVAAIGITNQRETTVVWDKNTGIPVYNAIVWQCRRTADYCEMIKGTELADYIHVNTGLVADAYFSATKIKWILDNVEGAREKAEHGDLLFGTIDTWLLWRLTDGRSHLTDETNASRTMLYNIRTHSWDERLCREFGIPMSMLPGVQASGSDFGYFEGDGVRVPICGIAGDQQSSLFGHGCFDRGSVKNTYGTGCFMLANTGSEPVMSNNGLVTTCAAAMDGEHKYALEGSVFTGGAVIQWLRDELKIIEHAGDTEPLAQSISDTAGVYVVPAFTGLGAPYWNMYARGMIIGLTRGTGRAHICRAALEAIAYQSDDVLNTMIRDIGFTPEEMKVDGGAAANGFLMQFQSDISGIRLARPRVLETTAAGAAMLAGLTCGYFRSASELTAMDRTDRVFSPTMDRARAADMVKMWHKAVSRSLDWIEK